MISQVLIVAGGMGDNNRLGSTEILRPSSGTWLYISPLRFDLEGLRGASIRDKFYISGGISGPQGNGKPHTGQFCQPSH